MKKVLSFRSISVILVSILLTTSCVFKDKSENADVVVSELQCGEVKIEAENLTESSEQFKIESLVSKKVYVKALSEGWIAFDVDIPIAGKYKSEIQVSSKSNKGVICWIEDNYDNKDDITYNITGDMILEKSSSNFSVIGKDGGSLNKGIHKMKLHFSNSVNIDWVKFTLL